MVDLARELDDDEEQPQKRPAKKKSSVIKIALLVLGVLCLVGGSIGGTLYFARAKPASGSVPAKTETTDKGNSDSQSQKPLYLALDPPFVVNFADKNQMRFLQVAIEVMAYDAKAIDAVKENMPVLRNNLVMLLSSQDADTLFSLAGKEKLRTQALEAIQKVVKKRTGHKGVQSVYFTSFVMQ
ncbi:MAG TPA: flagellar basal body-associated FliL family protein [Gammaproteobacteria bacterium]|nr:flagellar basal body-associated FliL family protein [Gammaproteobacteria bacterium]